MPSVSRTFLGAAMLAMVRSQGVILKAVGDSGTSTGLLVDPTKQNDANFISDAEIGKNLVNECGRTLLAGNMDIGENTEIALAAGAVTKVTKGSKVKVTIDQRNANGTGPFTCDMDFTSNAIATGQTPLTVDQGTAQSATGQVTLTVSTPKDMACKGSSAGNVCTIRCRNAQDFGGCVAIQQTDVTPLAGDNPPSNITSAQTLAGITAQIQQDQKDLPAAIAGNEAATNVADQGVKIAQAILDADPAIVAGANNEVASKTASAATAAKTAATATNNSNKGNGNAAKAGKKGGANANAAKGNANAATAATAGGATKGKGNAAGAAGATKGKGNAATGAGATGAAAKGKGNAATGANANANANANAATPGKAAKGAAAANKRETPAQRRARMLKLVNAGVDFAEDGN